MTSLCMTFASSLHRSRLLAAVLLAASATACTVVKDLAPLDGDTSSSTGLPSDTDDTATETTSGTTLEPEATTTGSTGSTTDEPDPVCACIDPDAYPEEGYVCDKGPCGLVEAKCKPGTEQHDESGVEGYCLTDDGFTLDEEALDCALDVLIAGEPGYVEYAHHTGSNLFISGPRHEFVQVLPGREGLTYSWQYIDHGAWISNAGVVPLKDAAYFAGCKAETDLEAKFWCLVGFSTEQPEPQCPAPTN